jgi:hypothetical protein
LLRNAQKRGKKKSSKTTEGGGGGKAAFFVMSPDGFFRNIFIVFLNSPCYETPKNAVKKIDKQIK